MDIFVRFCYFLFTFFFNFFRHSSNYRSTLNDADLEDLSNKGSENGESSLTPAEHRA